MKIPCISVLQPHASLIALHAKMIETRSRDFTGGFRGPLAIHASKKFQGYEQRLCYAIPSFADALRDYVVGLGGSLVQAKDYLPLGCIVAVCDLVDVVKITDRHQAVYVVSHHYEPEPRDLVPSVEHARMVKQELAFGDYTPGRYMLLLRNVVALPQPIPAKGRLGLWNFEMEDPRGETSHV